MKEMFDKGEEQIAEQQVVLQFIKYAALLKEALLNEMSDEERSTIEKQTDKLFQNIYLKYITFNSKQRSNMDWTGHPTEKRLFELIFEQYLNRLKNGEFSMEANTPSALKIKQQIEKEKMMINALRGSLSYKIGHWLTWIPRMFRATFHTIRSDGFKAVPARVANKLGILTGKRKPAPEATFVSTIQPVQASEWIPVTANTYSIKQEQESLQQPEAELKATSLSEAAGKMNCSFQNIPYDDNAPYVSVVLPTYNVAPYLDEAIGTLQRQTLHNFEMIFVDDGSTDDSVIIIESYMKDDQRIKLVCQKNQYAGVARNNGIDHAKGRYVVCLDPDDFFDANLLALNYQKAEQLSADIIIFGADIYNMQKKALEAASFLRFSGKLPQDRAFTGEDILENVFNLLNPWTKFYRHSFITENKLRYQALYSTNDAYFTMMAMALAKRIGALDSVLVHYRINRAGGLQETKAKFPRNVYEAFDATKRDLMAHGLFLKYRLPFLRKALESMFRSLDTVADEAASRDFFEFLQREGWQSLGLDDCSPGLFCETPHMERYQRFTSLRHIGFEEYWANRV